MKNSAKCVRLIIVVILVFELFPYEVIVAALLLDGVCSGVAG